MYLDGHQQGAKMKKPDLRFLPVKNNPNLTQE
jgi:hypothetical protein